MTWTRYRDTTDQRQPLIHCANAVYTRTCPTRSALETARRHACGAASGCQCLDNLTRRDPLRLAWNDASGQEVVDVSLLISAAIFHDDQTVGQILQQPSRTDESPTPLVA